MKFIIAIFLISLFSSGMQSTCKKSFIKIEYTGEPDKIFPTIILYTEDAIDTTYQSFVYKIEISKKEFKDVANEIYNTPKKGKIADTLPFPLLISMSDNASLDSLFINDKKHIKSLFKSINMRVVDSSSSSIMKLALHDLAGRLNLDNLPQNKNRINVINFR